MTFTHSHRWIVAPYRLDREQTYPQSTGRMTFVADCHHNLRGPYTGTGELMRQLAPLAQKHTPELVTKHITEILTTAPELQNQLSSKPETLTSLAVPEERTRFYSRLRTLRLANGLVDFLLALTQQKHIGPLTLIFERAQGADTLDREFLCTLLRRAQPTHLQVIISSSEEFAEDNDLYEALQAHAQPISPKTLTVAERRTLLNASSIPVDWQSWLLQHSSGWQGEWAIWQTVEFPDNPIDENTPFDLGIQQLLLSMPESSRQKLARAYVQADGATDHFLAYAAYEQLAPELRQTWHDERVNQLLALDEFSWQLGAIPFHLERGSNASEHGVAALRTALDYCIDIGFYDATVTFAKRGRQFVTFANQPNAYWAFTTKMTTSLAALNRPLEAEELYNEVRSLTDSPIILMQAAYATAMLYTRHHEQKDHTKAKEWILEAISIAQRIADPKDQAFHTVFNQNGLALVEMHLGNIDEALRLVTEGIDRLNRELEPHEHKLHRSVLVYNRAQILSGIRRYDEAIADYSKVIADDPNYAEYHFDRGNLYSRIGHLDEALADYNQAISLSPPFPEVYYNRAGIYTRMGDTEKALADYNYLLEIEPNHVDGLLNRASLYYETELIEQARRDVEHGLSIAPNHPQLLCTLGLVELAEGRNERAMQAFTTALDGDASLLEAWTNRAVLRYELDDIDGAIADLTHAMGLDPNATVLYNRAWAYQAQERWSEAIADYTEALHLPDADVQDIYFQRGLCYLQSGGLEASHEDWKRHLTFGDSLYLEKIAALAPTLFEQRQ